MKVKSVNPMDCSLSGSSAPGIFQERVLEWVAPTFSLLNYIIANFKAPKLSGYLVDLSAVITQLQLPSMNATGTNPDRRAQKAQHHHSARVPSECAGSCISLSPILPFTRVEALLRLKGRQTRVSLGPSTGRPRTLSVSNICLAFLTAEPRQD